MEERNLKLGKTWAETITLTSSSAAYFYAYIPAYGMTIVIEFTGGSSRGHIYTNAVRLPPETLLTLLEAKKKIRREDVCVARNGNTTYLLFTKSKYFAKFVDNKLEYDIRGVSEAHESLHAVLRELKRVCK